ncbi:hypothetical protein Tco_1011926, partial [Tanacetum coccineum]
MSSLHLCLMRSLRRDSRTSLLASTKAGMIIGSGFFEVDTQFVSGVFSGVLAVKVKAVIGGSSLTLGP